jgi:heptosyltransferase-3
MAIHKILVLAAGSLGDCILTLPALRALGREAQATVAGTSYYPLYASTLPGIVETPPLAQVYEPALAGNGEAFFAGFERTFLFFKDPDRALEDRLEAWRIRFHRPETAFGEFLKLRIYAGEYWMQLVESQGFKVQDRMPRLGDSRVHIGSGRALLKDWGLKRPAVIHPGSGGSAKLAPASFYAALARALAEKGRQVLVVWGESESIFLPEIRKVFDMPGVFIQPELVTLDGLAGILIESSAYYGNDSGVTHLAAACGTPTHAVFGPSDADIWAPAGAKVLRAGVKFARLTEGIPPDWLEPSPARN